MVYGISRYWNRLAYKIIHLGRFMIWDYTGKNKHLLDDINFASKASESILCDKKIKWSIDKWA